MIFDLKIRPYTIKDKTEYTKCITAGEKEFKLLTIDKDSYIVNAKVETGLDLQAKDGVYNLQIGKHSSLAEDILFIIDIDHNYLSIHQGIISVLAETKTKVKDSNEFTRKKEKIRKGQIIIENDCWIGHGATIMNGVTIHNGAVVGAEAVVTKDVPPYAVVAGNPAKIVKYRFDAETISKLEKICWWNWDDNKIRDNAFKFSQSATVFANTFINEAEEEIFKSVQGEFKAISDKNKYLYFMDFNENFPIYKYVIDSFVKKFDHFEAELVLVMPYEIEQEQIDEFLQYLNCYDKYDAFINIINYEWNEMSLFHQASYYITNRLPDNIRRMGFARIFGKECISGVDKPIFHN